MKSKKNTTPNDEPRRERRIRLRHSSIHPWLPAWRLPGSPPQTAPSSPTSPPGGGGPVPGGPMPAFLSFPPLNPSSSPPVGGLSPLGGPTTGTGPNGVSAFASANSPFTGVRNLIQNRPDPATGANSGLATPGALPGPLGLSQSQQPGGGQSTPAVANGAGDGSGDVGGPSGQPSPGTGAVSPAQKSTSPGSSTGNAADALASAQGDGAASGNAVGAAQNQTDAPPSSGSPQNSSSAGLLGASGTPLFHLPGASSTQPAVGGVLFDHSVSADFIVIGAGWDAASGSVVLLGEGDAKHCLPLQAEHRDWLRICLRASMLGLPVGVSIDPATLDRRGGRVREMLVSYLGLTRHTAVGRILYGSDFWLKVLSVGVDNVTLRPISPNVPNYRPLTHLMEPSQGAKREHAWERFWFMIDTCRLVKNEAAGAVTFGDTRLKVLCESEREGAGAEPSRPGVVWTGEMNEHLPHYYRELPMLRQLRELAKIAALAKYLCAVHCPLNLAALLQGATLPAETPDTVPAICVESPNVRVERHASSTVTYKISLCGGVDLEPRPVFASDADGAVRRLWEAALRHRGRQRHSPWSFEHGHRALQALPLDVNHLRDIGLRPVPPRFTFVDVARHSCKRPEVQTSRDRSRGTGPAPLLIYWQEDGQAVLYRHVADIDRRRFLFRTERTFCRVTQQTPNLSDGGFQFEYQPDDRIVSAGNSLCLHRDGSQRRFTRGDMTDI